MIPLNDSDSVTIPLAIPLANSPDKSYKMYFIFNYTSYELFFKIETSSEYEPILTYFFCMIYC